MHFFLILFLLYFALQYCIGFAIHWHESAMGVHEFPIMNPLPPPSSYHPSWLSQCTSPSILYPASNIDWRLISYLIIYMFQCHSPKSSHPLPLPQSPKVRSIYLCLFFCLSYRVIITIFLNSIRNKSPVQVRWRIQDAWGWCTGMTQRDGMRREMGG